MSDGLLKKRIRETPNRFRSGEGKWYEEEDLFKVLDEAAKQFPECFNCKHSKHDSAMAGGEMHFPVPVWICYLDSSADNIDCPINKWFKKWFSPKGEQT